MIVKRTILAITLLLVAFTKVNAQKWETNFNDAMERAVAQQKNVVLVFAGSDWCAPCIKLDKNIWESETFKELSAKKWVLYRADFPRKKANKLSDELKAANAQLFEKYNKSGSFPLVVLLSPNGEVLGKTGYKNLSPEKYIELLTSFE